NSNLNFGFSLTDADSNTIYGMRFTGNGTSILVQASAADQSTNNEILNNTITSGTTAIQISGGSGYKILNNIISGSGLQGIDFESGGSAIIQGNTITSRSYAVYANSGSLPISLTIGGAQPGNSNSFSSGAYGVYLGVNTDGSQVIGNSFDN